ncbi:MAG TPA: hypothetical protein GXZ21_12555 [Clostridiales bacterium]|nr:hypothetical protein [Clostridiales bacterium]
MAQLDFSHTVDIMKAATPYFDPKTRRSMDLFTKFFDLIGCYRNFLLPLEMASDESNNKKLDLEGLLTGIRPKCDERELPIVDQILGFFNAKRMFETYSNYMNMMNMMQGSKNQDSDSENGSDSNNSGFDLSSMFGGGSGFGDFSASDIQNMANMFNNSSDNSPAKEEEEEEETENKTSSSLSDMIAGLTDLVNSSSVDTNETADHNDAEETHLEHKDSVIEVDFSTGSKTGAKSYTSKHPFFYETLEGSGYFNNEDFTDYTDSIDPSGNQEDNDTTDDAEDNDITDDAEDVYAEFSNTESVSSDSNEENAPDNNQEMKADNNSNNSNVINMLKNMVSPEQMSTFENLSMLFKAMSYDNNDKTNKK